jgi:hypothetical protein
VTFFVAPGRITLPGGDWLTSMLAARSELDELVGAEQARTTRGMALRAQLERITAITLSDKDGIVNHLLFTFMHYCTDSRTLILAITANDPNPHRDYIAVDLDRLFKGQYDPAQQCLGGEDIAYAVVRLDEYMRPITTTVIQTWQEMDVPYPTAGVDASALLPSQLIGQLIELAA